MDPRCLAHENLQQTAGGSCGRPGSFCGGEPGHLGLETRLGHGEFCPVEWRPAPPRLRSFLAGRERAVPPLTSCLVPNVAEPPNGRGNPVESKSKVRKDFRYDQMSYYEIVGLRRNAVKAVIVEVQDAGGAPSATTGPRPRT